VEAYSLFPLLYSHPHLDQTVMQYCLAVKLPAMIRATYCRYRMIVQTLRLLSSRSSKWGCFRLCLALTSHSSSFHQLFSCLTSSHSSPLPKALSAPCLVHLLPNVNTLVHSDLLLLSAAPARLASIPHVKCLLLPIEGIFHPVL
jgi:hypothetical protein